MPLWNCVRNIKHYEFLYFCEWTFWALNASFFIIWTLRPLNSDANLYIQIETWIQKQLVWASEEILKKSVSEISSRSITGYHFKELFNNETLRTWYEKSAPMLESIQPNDERFWWWVFYIPFKLPPSFLTSCTFLKTWFRTNTSWSSSQSSKSSSIWSIGCSTSSFLTTKSNTTTSIKSSDTTSS